MPSRHFFEFGKFRLTPGDRELLHEGSPVALTPKAFDTLVLLVERQGGLVEKSEMMQALWPDTIVEEGNLAWNVSAVRKALGNGDVVYIETVPRRGYRFVADVKEVREQAEAPPDAAGPIVRHPARRWAAVAVVAVLAIGAAWTITGMRRSTVPPAAAVNARRSLAVLPLDGLTGKSGDEHLGIGVADTLIAKLTGINGLSVRPTSAIRKFTSRTIDSAAVGRELGVDSVLEGHIDRIADRFRVSVQLVNVADRSAFWADKFEEQASELFSVEDRIAERVAAALISGLRADDRRQLARRATSDVVAYDAYLRGQHQYNRRTIDGYWKAIQHFEDATARDPGYALAYAGLADSYMELGFATIAPTQMYPKAKAAALAGLAKNDSVPELHAAIARVSFNYDWDWPAAERGFRRSIALNDSYPQVHHWYAHYLAAMGRFDEALAETRRGLEIDPRDFRLVSHLAWHHLYAREYTQAVDAAKRALAADPRDGFTLLYLGQALRQSGRFTESDAAFRDAITTLEGTTRADAELGAAYALSGRASDAQRVIGRLRELAPREYVSPYSVATIYAALGDADHAVEWLTRAVDERSNAVVYVGIDPLFDALRGDARFATLMRRIGMPDRPSR